MPQVGIDHKLIRQTLRKRLLTVENLPSRVAWENETFVPPDPPAPHLRETYLPAFQGQTADARISATGIMQYDIVVPKGTGVEEAVTMADRIVAAFPLSQGLDGLVDVDRAEVGPSQTNDRWYWVPVRITWRTYAFPN